ncbi:sulfotransferase [Zhongshania sp. BJYM1]|uniref:sulfotransferase n=1 Tax=Zhongshania aquatica TaxID=2965069 RepID=UPI0022B422CE|nr:sulfotransferase [Marortus sp. BJYM1]
MKHRKDAHFPTSNEDAAKLDSICHLPIRPIFIMGLHRSGTTFLYDTVAKSFPLAHLSLYHLLYFDRLLTNKSHGTEQRDKDRLNRYFAANGISDRNIDGTHIDADAVEEYGFLLRKKSGTFKLNESNTDLFACLCQKLLAVQEGKKAVLLKNPWDTGNAKKILSYFPNARFIYISREPIAVLNSMLNALLAYLEGPQDYLETLLDNGSGRSGYRTGYIAWVILRILRKFLGRNITARLARGLLAKDVARQVVIYRKEITGMPRSSAIEIDYKSLVADPAATMRLLEPLLDIPITATGENIEVKQRSNLNPALQNYEETLSGLISNMT